jgi:AraC-like DNA-binding protein
VQIEKNAKVNWAGLAVDCGYYDQAHFIDDFKNFSGFTPLSYLSRKNEELNYVPVA